MYLYGSPLKAGIQGAGVSENAAWPRTVRQTGAETAGKRFVPGESSARDEKQALHPKLHQTRKAHKRHSQNSSRDQRDGNALEGLGHILEVQPLADAREKHERQSEA